MKNLLVIVLIAVFSLVLAPSASAFVVPEAIALEPAGILPTNPFYFVKEIGWGIKRFFTFNPVSKANLELEIAEKKLSEIKKMSEGDKNETAIARATEGYQDSLGRLKTKVENLNDTSRNPEVDKLLGDVVTRSLIHQEIFDVIKQENESINDELSDVDTVIDDVLATVPSKDDPEKFTERIEGTFKFLEGVEFLAPVEATLKAVEVIDSIEDKVNSEDLKEKLTGIKKDLSDRMVDGFDLDSSTHEPLDTFFNFLKKQFPINQIDENQAKVALMLAESAVQNLEDNMDQTVSLTNEEVRSILTKAEKILTEAKIAFDQKNYLKTLEKSQQVLNIVGSVDIVVQPLPLPEPVDSVLIEPVPGDGEIDPDYPPLEDDIPGTNGDLPVRVAPTIIHD